MAAASVIADCLYKKIGEQPPFITYPLVMLFRLFPACFFLVFGYWAAMLLTHWKHVLPQKAEAAAAALVCLCAFLAVQHRLGGGSNLHLFAYEKSVLVFLLTGILGSGTVLFASMLLPDTIRLLKKISRETLHIMVIHASPTKLLTGTVFIWERLFGPNLNLGSTVLVMLISYVCSVYIFEPLCRLAKARFDAIARQSGKR